MKSYVCIGEKKKKKNICRVCDSLGFQAHTGGLGTYTPQIRGEFIHVFINMYFYLIKDLKFLINQFVIQILISVAEYVIPFEVNVNNNFSKVLFSNRLLKYISLEHSF